MKRKVLSRCLFGAPMGVTILMAISLTAAHLRGDGKIRVGYYLIRVYGSEVNAVTAACLGSMVIGMIWSAASLIYRETDWSLLKQTLVHGAVCVLPSLVVAYMMYWMPRSMDGLLQYLGLFCLIYAVNWVGQYLRMKKRITDLNAKLQGERE